MILGGEGPKCFEQQIAALRQEAEAYVATKRRSAVFVKMFFSALKALGCLDACTFIGANPLFATNT